MNLVAQARDLGAIVNSRSVCLPAHALEEFLSIAAKAGCEIRYYECLYFHEAEGAAPGGTEPSMDLSRDFVPGQSVAEFIALAGQLSRIAAERALKQNIRAFYEVGLEPDLDPSEADIPVRR